MIKVSNINGIPNQFIIVDYNNNVEIFQSYDSIIAIKDRGESCAVTLDEKFWDYSKTTGKYRSIFLGESKPETQKKINAGIYKVSNLNYQ